MQWQTATLQKGWPWASSRFGSSIDGMATAKLQKDGESQAIAIAEATVGSIAVATVVGDVEDGQKQKGMWILKHLVGAIVLGELSVKLKKVSLKWLASS